MQLNAQNYDNTHYSHQSACFAGCNEELVAAGSGDGNIYMWSVGNYLSSSSATVQQPLIVLPAGKQVKKSIVRHVRYNSSICALASCSDEPIVKFWTPFAIPNEPAGAGPR